MQTKNGMIPAKKNLKQIKLSQTHVLTYTAVAHSEAETPADASVSPSIASWPQHGHPDRAMASEAEWILCPMYQPAQLGAVDDWVDHG